MRLVDKDKPLINACLYLPMKKRPSLIYYPAIFAFFAIGVEKPPSLSGEAFCLRIVEKEGLGGIRLLRQGILTRISLKATVWLRVTTGTGRGFWDGRLHARAFPLLAAGRPR